MRRELLLSVGAGTGLSVLGGAGTAGADDSERPDSDDESASFDGRVAHLLGELSVDEKASLLHQYQPPIPREDLDSFRTGTEALHGVAWLGEATVFPQAIGLASTWNPKLIKRVGDAVGDEVRGKHDASNGGVGLNVWSPTVDPLRDPRWGRNEEGYSEDPLLNDEIATAYLDGLTGDDPDFLKTAPILKHFIGYNNETERTTTNAQVPPRLLHDYYLPFFRRPIESGGAVGVMASYNVLNGRPMTASPLLNRVREWAPDGRAVLNVSDAWAPVNLTGAQEYFESETRARAAALIAGLDSFTEYGSDSTATVEAILAALEEGHLSEDDLNEAVGHVLTVRSRLGELTSTETEPYADKTAAVIGRPEHRELARKAAREQAVLLKNEGREPVLPIGDEERVAVLGPLSDRVFEDWYSGTAPYRITPREGLRDQLGAERISTAVGADKIALVEQSTGEYVTAGVGKGGGVLGLGETDAPSVQEFEVVQWTDSVRTLQAMANDRYVTVEDEQLVNAAERPFGWENVQEGFEFVEVDDDTIALRHPASDRYVALEDGSLLVSAEQESAAARFEIDVREDGIETALEAVAEADVAVITVGTHPLIGGRETQDRDDLALAPAQRKLVERVADAHPRSAVVLETSYPVSMQGWHHRVPSILWTSHAGQETGRALADVLVGECAPGGRLTQTWPRSVDQLPDLFEYNIAETEMTYRYGQADPLYAFGHGLSYSSFEYGRLRISPRGMLRAGDEATISVEVTNTGSMAADEVVQVYTSQRRSRTKQPDLVLRGFERVHLEPGERTRVEVSIDHEAFSIWDVTSRQQVVERSTQAVLVGSASDDIRRWGRLRVDGERIRSRDLSEKTRLVDADDWSWDDIELLDRSKADGTVVGMSDGSWVSFATVDLRERPSEATVSVASADSDGTTIELRSGSPSGRVLGRTEAPSTGGVYDYQDVTMSLDRAVGHNRELYVVTRGGSVRIDTIHLE
ncbi:hypothetical protein HALLA_03250 (plasmid) [Halostagnicola larsenii XH-48]|uniref:CBM6 domain-containing protein n=2 Tax=Halostagnicola larsenii TaxID=353800 RepID=W0JVR7_9EURY|nr:hypothetical protein HALLA_03250 [Halostagnicola larsenii XH-48]